MESKPIKVDNNLEIEHKFAPQTIRYLNQSFSDEEIDEKMKYWQEIQVLYICINNIISLAHWQIIINKKYKKYLGRIKINKQ